MRRIGAFLVFMIMVGCIQNDKHELTICCAGDSLMRPIPHHLREILKISKRKIRIRDWSRGGLSSQSYQAFFRRHYHRWRRTRPDFILIQLGTNDVIPLLHNEYKMSYFRNNLSAIIKNFRKFKGNRFKCPKIFVASIPLFYLESSSKEKNQWIKKEINPAIEEIAREEKSVFVDNFSVLSNRTHLYSPDGVHPNSRGEKALARNWLFWIRNELRKSY